MKHSFTYYITLFIIRLNGVKKDFSKDPIDYNKIRKEDVHHPKGMFYKQEYIKRFKIQKTLITEINMYKNSTSLLIFIPGGAFISGPAKHHWNSVKQIAKKTNHNIWMCDYPKAPEHKIVEISNNIDSIYNVALKKYSAKNIILIGDSVGGTLITTLIQRLIPNKVELPRKIILISPVMDATMSNYKIDSKDVSDPILSKSGVVSAKKMCIDDGNLSNEVISPIYGDFSCFPNTILFIAENDITYPDQTIVIKKLIKAKTDLEVIEGKGMPHIWPFLPVMKEARIALGDIIDRLNIN